MKKLLLAAGIGMCIFAMATTDTNAGSYEYRDLTQDTTPKKKDTTKPKKDDSLKRSVSISCQINFLEGYKRTDQQ